jgi:ElaB/YqjD/DUF883 family membrane-anchored ribosome-binding protein
MPENQSNTPSNRPSDNASTQSVQSNTGQTQSGLTHQASSATPAATATARGASGDIDSQTQNYTQKITDVAAQARDKITDAASQARDFVSDKVSVVGDKIKDLQNKDLNEIAENAKDYARQNPGQALLISAAAGFLIGLLIRGSRR